MRIGRAKRDPLGRAGVVLLTLVAASAQDPSWSRQTPNFWTTEQRDAGFRAMEKVYSTKTVAAGKTIHRFGQGKPLTLSFDVHAYMKSQRVAGLIVIQKNAIRLEKYALGFAAKGHWESFSVAKSMTGTLVGAAMQDGYIKSLDDSVAKYVTGLRGSAYEAVNIRQLLTMTSGVKWNEDYRNPNSDAVRLRLHRPDPGVDTTVSYMRQLPREFEPGSRWVYKTGETNLVGVLVSQATGKPLSQYLSEKIWKPYGMEQPALWELDESGAEMGGCCLSANLRDYARFGQFILDGGKIDGKAVVAPAWLEQATHKQVAIGAGRGYGFFWWTNDDGSFQAQGIYGQNIFIDPKRQLVVATVADWNEATDSAASSARNEFLRAIQSSIDSDRNRMQTVERRR